MNWLFVALGGGIGAVTRFALSAWLSPEPGKFPVATFTANILGCALMGLLYVLIVDKQILPLAWRAPLMVGFLGALTTFSTFSLEALSLWQTGHIQMALLYVCLTLIFTLVAAWLGYSLAELIISND